MSDKYELCELFDCTDMPDDVRKAFFDKNSNTINDVIVDWDFYMPEDDDFEYEADRLVNTWLHKNGATGDNGVLIKHWW